MYLKANVCSDEHIHTTAYSVFKPTLNEDYQLLKQMVVWMGIQHRWLNCLMLSIFLTDRSSLKLELQKLSCETLLKIA